MLDGNFKKWQIDTSGDREGLYKIFKKKLKLLDLAEPMLELMRGDNALILLNHKINDSYKFLSRINFYLSAHQISIINLKKEI